MKIHVLSDLHLECSMPKENLGCVASDVVVLAGDIHTGTLGIEWAGETWIDRPVIYVAGNHEYYGREYTTHRNAMRQVAAGFGNVRLLDRDAVVIQDVVFAGATLWTNYEYSSVGDPVRKLSAMSTAMQNMDDHRLIHFGDGKSSVSRPFLPKDAAEIFDIEHLYLRETLTSSSDKLAERFNANHIRKRVAVSHHLPSGRSIHPRFAQSELNPAFASRLESTIALADVWVHGHTHDSCDYLVARTEGKQTRVICNPRGYSMYAMDVGNYAFRPSMVIEV